jgi:putative transposase
MERWEYTKEKYTPRIADMSNQTYDRRQQGQLIAQAKGSIKRLDDKRYIVNSQSGSGSYNIHITELGFVCSCPDHVYRGVKCKHIHAIDVLRKLVKK